MRFLLIREVLILGSFEEGESQIATWSRPHTQMSRIIVKNLPTYITEPLLRTHFASKPNAGELTDVRIVHKNDGKIRRIAFLGYKTEDEAKSAKDYFDKSYLDISKLRVEIVTGTKDEPRRDNERKRQRDVGDIGGEDRRKKLKSDAKLPSDSATPANKRDNGKESHRKEFEKVMLSKAKSRPAWAADVEPQEQSSPPEAKKESNVNEVVEETSADANDEGVSDMEWMRRRMGNGAVGEAFEQSDDESKGDRGKKQREEATEAIDTTHQAIQSNGRLFIRNLTFSCTEVELKSHFGAFGDIEEVHIPLDGSNNTKGFAYVRFKNPSHAVEAFEKVDGTSFQGRLIHILPAADRQGKNMEETEGRPARLREAKAQKRKEASGKDFNWAVLYMNSDAVANSIAERMGIPKAEILNPEGGGSGAVKLALAETHIITETKKYLEKNNVDLSLFTRARAPRSNRIILVKNIPYGTTQAELRELFGTHGKLKRLLLPPAGTIAIVEFGNGEEAANAYRAIAYSRLKGGIIYLEKAPDGLLDGQMIEEKPAEEKIEENEEDEVPPGATLHVSNLSFGTTSERLTAVFRHLPAFAFAKVAMKSDPSKPGTLLSQGFGFVGFKDVESAKKAMKGTGNGFVLDGHVLKVNFAGRGKEDMDKENKVIGKGKSTKLIVKNLAFEVTRKELIELFSSHGHVKSVRLPNRADRRSRGFAFVDFSTRREAEGAMEALRHTHLLGRHLVLEWAELGEGIDVDEKRRKTKVEFGNGIHGGEDMGRKQRVTIESNE